MGRIILGGLIGLFYTSFAWGVTAINICGAMASVGSTVQSNYCFDVIEGNSYPSEKALKICSHLQKYGEHALAIDCLTITANKDFVETGKIDSCEKMVHKGHSVQGLICLESCTVKQSQSPEAKIDHVLEALNQNDIDRAKEMLIELRGQLAE